MITPPTSTPPPTQRRSDFLVFFFGNFSHNGLPINQFKGIFRYNSAKFKKNVMSEIL